MNFPLRKGPSGPKFPADPPPPSNSIRRMLLNTTLTDSPIILSNLGTTPLQKNSLTPFELNMDNPSPDRIYSGRVDCQMRLDPGTFGYSIDTELALEVSVDEGLNWTAVVSGQQAIFNATPQQAVGGGSCLCSVSLPQKTGAELGVISTTTSLRLRASAAVLPGQAPPAEVFSESGLGAGGTLALQFTEQNP